MDAITAVNVIEDITPVDDEDEVIEAWQFLIDHGYIQHFQGSYQRMALALINSGQCTSPRES